MFKNAINKIFGKKWKAPDGQQFVAVEMDVDVYHNKGIQYLDAKQYEKAIAMFQKEIECEPGAGSIGYHSLGQAYQAMGKTEEARKHYEIALKKTEEMSQKYPGSIDREAIEEIKKDLDSLGV